MLSYWSASGLSWQSSSGGPRFATQISEDPDLGGMPIVVLSALEPSRTMFQRFSQVAAFLTKPFNTDDLMEAVKNGLAKKQ